MASQSNLEWLGATPGSLNLVAVPIVQTNMLHLVVVIAGFILIGLACCGFWQRLKVKPHDNIPRSKGNRWRT